MDPYAEALAKQTAALERIAVAAEVQAKAMEALVTMDGQRFANFVAAVVAELKAKGIDLD